MERRRGNAAVPSFDSDAPASPQVEGPQISHPREAGNPGCRAFRGAPIRGFGMSKE
jgi:hypothetical protein